MARTLTFEVGGVAHQVNPVKVDRAKLYGWTQTVALDADQNVCELALVDRDGTAVVPPGGAGIGLLNAGGAWVERSSLVTFTADGQPAPVRPSSFDAEVSLEQRVSADDVLDVTVSAVYQLDDDESLVATLGDDIYTFDYRFRAGASGATAFVLASGGRAFLLTGQPVSFGFVGLDQAVDVADEDAGDDDGDDLDFGMI